MCIVDLRFGSLHSSCLAAPDIRSSRVACLSVSPDCEASSCCNQKQRVGQQRVWCLRFVSCDTKFVPLPPPPNNQWSKTSSVQTRGQPGQGWIFSVICHSLCSCLKKGTPHDEKDEAAFISCSLEPLLLDFQVQLCLLRTVCFVFLAGYEEGILLLGSCWHLFCLCPNCGSSSCFLQEGRFCWCSTCSVCIQGEVSTALGSGSCVEPRHCQSSLKNLGRIFQANCVCLKHAESLPS